ncbi:MAG TPA: hypothetical protein PKE69_01685 [Pyrinomonadaceae bacterium]|nr:hypothetical protein [Pyrinomonadaceae bacterium]
MQRKLTISISDETYESLMNSVGKKNASRFIESLLRSNILKSEKDVIKLPLDESKTYRILSPRLADPSQADILEVTHIKN